MNIKQDILKLIGNTPMVFLNKLNNGAKIALKLESFNPAGSIKDRVALNIIEDAEKKSLITPNKSTLIEPTSGNTGIGLAMVSAVKGYRLILTMPENMSLERRKLLSFFGAEIVLTSAALGMKGAIEKAEELQKSIPDSMIMGQFSNPANPNAHYATTAQEIWNDTNFKVDALVAGIGTGGTFSGIAKFLKEKNPNIKAIAVEPCESAVLSGEPAGVHGIQGIGAGFVPENMDTSLIDEIIKVNCNDAINTSRALAKEEGILSGISGGAALFAALEFASREENKDKLIVVIIPDGAEKYLSTALFE